MAMMDLSPHTVAMNAETNLARRLKRLMDAQGTNPAALSRKAGLNHTFIRDILKGHTRSPKVENMQKLAGALNITVQDLVEDSDLLLAESAQPVPPGGKKPGFSETQLDPWAPPEISAHRELQPRAMLVDLAPDARHPTALRLREAVFGFALLAGDVVVVDLNARAEPGNIVVVNSATDSGDAVTLIRRFHPPYLISGDPQDTTALLADGARHAIMGPVVASFRQSKS